MSENILESYSKVPPSSRLLKFVIPLEYIFENLKNLKKANKLRAQRSQMHQNCNKNNMSEARQQEAA